MTTPVAPPPDTTTLRQELRSVVALREQVTKLDALLAERKQSWEQENAPLLQAQALAREALRTVEANSKALTLAAYERTGEKRPAPGCEIKVITKLQYDVAAAAAWAEEKGMCLIPESLDVAAFEKIVKASPDSFPWVQFLGLPQAQLATKLAEALAAAELTEGAVAR